MAVSCLAGSFNTGTGALNSTIDVTGSITISGTSVVILFFNGRTEATDTAGRESRWRGIGVAKSSTERWCQVSQSQDAVAAVTGGSYHSNAACLASMTTGTAANGLLDFDSWLSNGFRLIVDDVLPRDFRVGYLIITGLTNAATGSWQDSGTTGDKVITTGLSFQPDAVFMAATVIDTTPPGGRAGNEMLGLGFAVSATQQATWTGGNDEGSASSDSDSYCNDVECLSSITAGGGTTLASRYTFVSFNSNGFTLNQSLVPATIGWNHFLALQGGSYKVTNVSTRTDTNDITSPSLGFTPAGVLLLSAYKAEHTAGTPTIHDTWSMGVASSATNRFSCAVWDEDGLADTEVYTAIEHDEVYIAISNTPAVEGLMDIKTWSDPLVFVMDDADPSAKFVPMLVIGNTGGSAQTITANGFANSSTFGSPTLNLELTANGFANSSAFSGPVITTGEVIVSANGFASTQVFGTATVANTSGPQTITANGFANTSAYGSPTVTPGTVTLTANGYADADAFGSPTITQGYLISPNGIADTDSFGNPTVTPGAVTIAANGIANVDNFGTAIIDQSGGTQNITANGIANVDSFGAPTISVGATVVYPNGRASTITFGNTTVAGGALPTGTISIVVTHEAIDYVTASHIATDEIISVRNELTETQVVHYSTDDLIVERLETSTIEVIV